MRNIFLGLIYFYFTSKFTDAAINPEDKTYKVMLGEENVPIKWFYDNEESMLIVSWTFKNSTSQPATTVMTKLNGFAAQPVVGYNISYDQNGTIQLQKITDEYLGIYYCAVSYTGASGFPPVTGTATIVLQEATTVTDGELELWKYILIAIGATIGFLFLIGIILGIIIICPICCSESFLNQDGCDNCVDNSYCSCKCCASTPCGACCNIEELPFWYKVLWASIICIPIALGILLIWKCCGQTNEPHRNDSRNNSSGDVPLNTKYSN